MGVAWLRYDECMRAFLFLPLVLLGCGDDEKNAPADARVDSFSSDEDAAVDAMPDAAVAAFRIEEVGLDLDVDGANTEFVEITGEPGASLDDLAIRVIAADGTETSTYALSETAGTTMPSDGHWVIGGAVVTGVDQIYAVAQDDWDLDGTAGAIQLLDTSGATPVLLDVVGYSFSGTAVTAAGNLSAPTETVEGSAENISTGAASDNGIGRAAAAADTNDNAADFCLQAKTPGAANGTCP